MDRYSMGSAHRLLLILVMAYLVPSARPDSFLTLSPDAGYLLALRNHTSGTRESANNIKEVNHTPATTAPTSSSESGFSSSVTSSSSDEETLPSPPQNATPTSSISSLNPNTSDNSLVQSNSTTPSAAKSAPSKSSTAPVDSLSNENDGLKADHSTTIATVLPIVFGSLACIGAVVMFVMYKKRKQDADTTCLSSVSEYKGSDFLAENETAHVQQKNMPSRPQKVEILGCISSNTVGNSTGLNSSVSSSSPFGSTQCKGRVSSPVPSTSDTNMEFQDTGPRLEGSDIVLKFEETQATTISHLTPRVQL